MSKAARNRRKRQEAKAAVKERPLEAHEAMGVILDLETVDDFLRLIEDRPGVLAEAVEAEFARVSRLEGFETTGDALATLVREARTVPRSAWERYRAKMDEAGQLSSDLEPEIALIDAAVEAGRHEEVIERVESALPRARAAGMGVGVGVLHSQRGTAHVYRSEGNRAQNIELAIEDYAAALELVISKEQRAEVLMHAGIAYLERVPGDRAENVEQAISLLREALAELDDASPPERHAITLTNLAVGLIRRQRGKRADSLSEAAALCRSALEYRSPERNAYDWAHSQISLGDALELLSSLGVADPDEAIAAYEAVLAEADRIGQEWLPGAAHHALGRLYRRRAHPSTQQRAEAALEDGDLEVDRGLLENARQHLEAARPLVANAPHYLLAGRVAEELSAVLRDLGDESDRTLGIAREALSILRPTAAPDDCINAGFRLGGMLATRGEWEESAEAYRDAVQAAELNFHARLETSSREADIRGMGNLFRWAAFAIAAAGEPLEAALVLESGRTREFRRRLGLERHEAERIDELPAELAERYRAAVADLARAPLGGPAGRELQETLDGIRGVPGFEDFGGAAQPEDLAAAVESAWPLIYVDPTPAGTLLLLAMEGGPAGIEAEAVFLGPDALSVYLRMMAGDAAADLSLVDEAEPSSYLALVGAVSDRLPQRDLEQALPWLGEAIARPIRDVAREVGAEGVTLVPCGPISVAPLHASPWEAGAGRRQCLVDELEVRYAQSALIAGTGLQRAPERQAETPTLVALANPTRDLPAAEPEAAEIVEHFASDCASVATGDDATAAFLRRHTRDATHLHLACHARGGLLDTNSPAAVLLADGWLPANVLTELPLRSRLVAVSACQSALTNIAELGDESISIGSVMMAAGSACAIASLWPVHDLATALLMTRLYEELFNGGHRPPEALRRAQLWLRDLDLAGEQAFLDRHATLRAEFDQRATRDGLPGDRRSATRSTTTRPYANEYYWGAFIAVGA